MSSINFFHKQYTKEEPRTDLTFGIGDDGKLAFTTFDEEQQIAIVINNTPQIIQFTPVDHNIVIMENGNERSMCDGMLYIPATKELIFVELKTGDKSWLPDAIRQLKSTIAVFSQNHVLSDYNKRNAYAANRQHPCFQSSKKDDSTLFRAETKFRLNPTNRIVVK